MFLAELVLVTLTLIRLCQISNVCKSFVHWPLHILMLGPKKGTNLKLIYRHQKSVFFLQFLFLAELVLVTLTLIRLCQISNVATNTIISNVCKSFVLWPLHILMLGPKKGTLRRKIWNWYIGTRSLLCFSNFCFWQNYVSDTYSYTSVPNFKCSN